MHRREFLLSATGIVGASTVGSIAYTSATVERDVTSSVAADASAIIGLVDGGVGAVSKTNGKLQINTDASSSGLNVDSTFWYGDDSSPTSTYAFKISNNSDSSETITLALTDGSSSAMNLPTNAVFNIHVHTSSSNKVGTASPGSSLDIPLDASGETTDEAYAVIEIQTPTSNSDITGAMKFTA
ncbi:hypothetical protein [Halorubellus litoreus]|uniref:CHRD domain-containing protein n=1 Tax=Halorubellus litoreus TaxID=755308 RepID=A0ABD5VFP8_9EURY